MAGARDALENRLCLLERAELGEDDLAVDRDDPVDRPCAVVDRDVLQRTMSRHAGIGRTAEGLAAASVELDRASVMRPIPSRARALTASRLRTN